MPISLLPQFFIICILSTLTISITNFTHAYNQCMEDQKTLLLELKNDLIFNSSLSTKLVQWNQTDDCCSWEGVECDAAGRVVSLQLGDEGISGGFENSSSLFSFRYLKKLNLGFNNFNGAQIPRGIGNLTYLTHLNLANAGFGGQVPVELSLLTRLVSLDLSTGYAVTNQGMLPIWYLGIQPLKLEYPNLGMLLQNLTGLKELYLDSVNISAHRSEWYHVISSSLPNLRNLSLYFCDLPAPLDPYLSQFHSLTLLQLDGNNLSSIVPNFFANFSTLTTLSLSRCSLKGSLDLPNNFLTGSHSSTLFRGLFYLVYLDLGFNSLSGNIPESLFGLPSLKTLFLFDNQFSGQVNEFPTQNYSNIEVLDLRNNQLEGPIPESFFQLESLEDLTLSYNFFSGTFKLEKIQRLRNLGTLDLSYNNLSVDTSNINSSLSTFPQLNSLRLASCNLYNFPDFIKQSSTLSYLDLSNNRIAGEIPSWIWEIGNGELQFLNLSCNLLVDLQKPYQIPSSLWMLDLHSNQLQGELPLPPQQADYVDYSNNNFDKPIPPNIGNFTSSLSFFSLTNNNLSGSIPPSLCNSVSLQVLDLSVNKLTGNIPPCLVEKIEGLQVVNLGRNNISGDIPDKFSVNCGLKTLDLSDNNLAGNFPLSLANCKSLVVMNIGNNNINDSFPCMLSSSLRVLVLRSNTFHGEIKCPKSWPNLQIIDIASNNFSGNLYPTNFSSWKGMMLNSDAQSRSSRLGFNFLSPNHYYRDEVTLTIKGLELKLVKIWPDFTSIDFSCNNFHGEIPDAIGDLNSLYLLNLSYNALTGTIPKSFGNLTELGSLDLSMNELTGVIPMELAKLTFLSALNLSYNKLVGEIPNGPQFPTFSPACFEGNTWLCGEPVNISCSNSDVSSPPKVRNVQPHAKMEIEWDYVSAALGFVVGLGSIVWVLLGLCKFEAKVL